MAYDLSCTVAFPKIIIYFALKKYTTIINRKKIDLRTWMYVLETTKFFFNSVKTISVFTLKPTNLCYPLFDK